MTATSVLRLAGGPQGPQLRDERGPEGPRLRPALALVLALVVLPVAARAEDGYDLWLRYAPIEIATLRDTYRRAIAGVVVQQSPATAAIVSKELAHGLEGDRKSTR